MNELSNNSISMIKFLQQPIFVLVLFISVIAALIRSAGMNESLWVDELHTAWVVGDSWNDIPERAALGNNHPCYFYLVKAVTTVFGLNEWGLRLISWLAGTAFCSIAAVIICRWTGQWLPAFVVGICLALDRDHIFYATEARSYALAQLIGLIQIYLFYASLQNRKINSIISCSLLSAVMIYLHFTTGLLLIAESCYLIFIAIKTKSIKEIKPGMMILLISSLCCVPAISQVLEIHGRKANWATFIRTNSALELFTIFPLVWLIVIPGFIWLLTGSYKRFNQKPNDEIQSESPEFLLHNHYGRFPWLLLLIVSILPLVMAWYFTYQEWLAIFLRRYLLISLATIFLITGGIISKLPSKWLQAIVAVILLGFAIQYRVPRTVNLQHFVIYQRFEDWRSAIYFINEEKVDQQLPVLIYSGLIEADGLRDTPTVLLKEYSCLPLLTLYQINNKQELIPLTIRESGRLESWQAESLLKVDGAWLVVRGSTSRSNQTMKEINQSLQDFSNNKVTINAEDGQSKEYAGVQVVKLKINRDL